MAQEWKVILRVPRIRLLAGERNREFVLGREQEPRYLQAASQPLRDVALLILDTGLRVGEAVALQWPDVKLEPIGGAKLGFLHIRRGKSKNAKRILPLTGRVREMLRCRLDDAKQNATGNDVSPWVFSSPNCRPISVDYLDRAHFQLRRALNLPTDFVLHSVRHTMLTRLGESGVDAFTIRRIAGHSTIVMSQRYVHPSPEAMEMAFERLEALNEKVALQAKEEAKRQLVATIAATPKDAMVTRMN